jgi:hypothetical protein
MSTFIPTDPIGFPNVIFGSPTQSGRVSPGDLITAEFINSILARLDALESRLKQLEGGQPTFTLPTFTLPTTFTMPTITFHPTFQTKIIETQPTFRHPTVLTPSEMPTRNLGTFVATLVRPPEEEIALDLGPYVIAADKGIFPPESEVTALPGIGEKEKGLLDKANIKNVRDVSQMDAKVLAQTLDMKREDANALVGMANNVMIKQQITH